jgi:hypothetical protein
LIAGDRISRATITPNQGATAHEVNTKAVIFHQVDFAKTNQISLEKLNFGGR